MWFTNIAIAATFVVTMLALATQDPVAITSLIFWLCILIWKGDALISEIRTLFKGRSRS